MQKTLSMHLIRLFLNMPEILCLGTFVTKTGLMAMKYNIILIDTTRYVVLINKENGLRNVVNTIYASPFIQFLA